MKSGAGSRRKKLSDIARHVVVPDGVVATGWPGVRSKLRLMGVEFDPWQEDAARLILAKRADGQYAAAVEGAVMSIPRQVGKTFMIGAIAFALCLIEPGLKAIWTAHHSKTSDETFESLTGFARMPKVAPHIEKILTGGGAQEIVFKNASRIQFGARERGFGRGKTRTGLLVLDEASILTDNAIDNLYPTMSRARNPLAILMGTPPRPQDPGFVFGRMREEALSGDSTDMAYIEFSADPDGKIDDRAQWRIANPSYPRHTSATAIQRLRKALTPESFRREVLGVWDRTEAEKPLFSQGDWACLADEGIPDGASVVGVKFSPDGAYVGVAAAVKPADGAVFVAGVRLAPYCEGLGWLTDWLEPRRDRFVQVVVDGRAGVSALVEAFEARGMKARVKAAPASRFIRVTTLAEYQEAHVLFERAVRDGDLAHDGGAELARQIGNAKKRAIGTAGGWGWQGIGDQDVTLLDAATLAVWGAKTTRRRAKN